MHTGPFFFPLSVAFGYFRDAVWPVCMLHFGQIYCCRHSRWFQVWLKELGFAVSAQTCCMCAGIDVDIDVEHEGQRTKVNPPSESGGVEKDMEVGGATEGSKVSFIVRTNVSCIYSSSCKSQQPLVQGYSTRLGRGPQL